MTLGEYASLAVTSIFVITDPIAVMPAFIAMTPDNSPPERLHMARLACWVAAGVLVLFAAGGNFIFKVMGITLPAFQLAGRLLPFRVALGIVLARRPRSADADEEVTSGA